jgi:hypothetical protein
MGSIPSAMLEQEGHTLGLRESSLPCRAIGSPQQIQIRGFIYAQWPRLLPGPVKHLVLLLSSNLKEDILTAGATAGYACAGHSQSL